MFCKNCGTQIDDNAAFCLSCGAPTKKQETPASPVAETPVKPSANNNSTIYAGEIEEPGIAVEQPVPQPVQQPAPQPIQQSAPQPAPQPYTPQYSQPVQQSAPQPAPQYSQPMQQPVNNAQMYGQPMQQPMMQTPPVSNNPAPKKGKGALIAILVAILVIALGAGGFCAYWFTRPIYKVNKAIEASDISTVASLYSKLSDKDKTSVEDKMLDICKDAAKSYKKGEIEYSELDETLDTLEPVLNGNKDYDKIVESSKAIKDSRSAFEDAEKAFENEEYEEAIELYSNVIEEDADNYENAQARIEECNELLIPDIVGTWVNVQDIGPDAFEEVGYSTQFSIPVEVTYEFYDDGTGYLSLVVPNESEMYDDMLDAIVEEWYDDFADEGYSRYQLDDAIGELYYGWSLRDYIEYETELPYNEYQYDYYYEYFSYEVDSEGVHLTPEYGDPYDGVIEDNSITFDNFTSTNWIYSEVDLDTPATFDKVEE